MRYLLTIPILIQLAYGLDKATIADLKKYKGTSATFITITNEYEYGVYFKYFGTEPADGGVVVADGLGNKWKRIYKTVSPTLWGAIPNDMIDDLPAFKKAFAFCERTGAAIVMEDGVFRNTETAIAGGVSLDARESLRYAAFDRTAPSYDINGVLTQNNNKPFTISGSSRTIIWGDFQPTKLTAILHHGYWGINVDESSPNVNISNLIIVGKNGGKFIDGQFILQNVVTENQVGLLMQRSEGSINVNDNQFHGLQIGKLTNAMYFVKSDGNKYSWCDTGFVNFRSHSTPEENMYFHYCKLGGLVDGGASGYKQINAEQCGTAIQFLTGNNSASDLYLEQNTWSSTATDYQIKIGYDKGHPDYGTYVQRITITNATIGCLDRKAILVSKGGDVSLKDINASSYILHVEEGAKANYETSEIGYITGLGEVKLKEQSMPVNSGIYTPYVQAQSYCDAKANGNFIYTQIGGVVSVSGELFIDRGSEVMLQRYPEGNPVISISLPIPSGTQDLHGTITGGEITGNDPSKNRAWITTTSKTTGKYKINFSYLLNPLIQ